MPTNNNHIYKISSWYSFFMQQIKNSQRNSAQYMLANNFMHRIATPLNFQPSKNFRWKKISGAMGRCTREEKVAHYNTLRKNNDTLHPSDFNKHFSISLCILQCNLWLGNYKTVAALKCSEMYAILVFLFIGMCMFGCVMWCQMNSSFFCHGNRNSPESRMMLMLKPM